MIYDSKYYALVNRGDKYLLRKVIQYLDPQPTDKILEIGCGRGFFTKKIQSLTKLTIGIDINPKAIAKGVTDNLKVMDATHLNFPSEFFDKIYSCHTIEHIPDLNRFFQEIERVLKSGGRLLLVYPWELIRGMGAIGSSLIIFKHPFYCRKIHLHKLNPEKVQALAANCQFRHIESHFSFFTTPQYFTILEKIKSGSSVVD